MNNRIIIGLIALVILILIIANWGKIKNFFGRKSLPASETNTSTETPTSTSTSTSTATGGSNNVVHRVRVSNPNGTMLFILNPDTSMGGLKDTAQGLAFNTIVNYVNKTNTHYCVKNECKMPADFYELDNKQFVLATDVTEI